MTVAINQNRIQCLLRQIVIYNCTHKNNFLIFKNITDQYKYILHERKQSINIFLNLNIWILSYLEKTYFAVIYLHFFSDLLVLFLDYLHTTMYTCSMKCVYEYMRMWRPDVDARWLRCLSFTLFTGRPVLSLNLELSNVAHLAGQLIGDCLSLPPQCWDHRLSVGVTGWVLG